ncbi:hypothetical protein FACS1894180_8700 [Bacteroidia bacterium]|nr:hypothetical protein FACS1894180_8700 [Bacteroidia bacterium]
MEVLKSILTTLSVVTAAFFTQSEGALYLLAFLFAGNIVVGITTDIFFNNNQFSFKKFLFALFELMIYIGLVVGVVVITHFLNEAAVGEYALKVLSWLFVYAYGVNILKNLQQIFPANVVISFLYYVLSFELIKKIPYFKDFQNKKENKQTTEEPKPESDPLIPNS